MSVLIVVESCFGNTFTVARAIADGLAQHLGQDAITVVRPGEAPGEVLPEVRLLLVGAPTHAFSMPKEQSRKEAADKGASIGDDSGLREWLTAVTSRADLRVLTFDTSIKLKFTPGSASKAAFKALRKRGFSQAERGQSFYVTGTTGPLTDGEDQRAQAWGAQLGAELGGQLGVRPS